MKSGNLKTMRLCLLFISVLSLLVSAASPAPALDMTSLPNRNTELPSTTWFVTPTGDNTNSCDSAAAPCLTINAVLGKAKAGDTIKAAIGTYTDFSYFLVADINKNIIISGGWTLDFASQTGFSTLDGRMVGRVVTIGSGVTVVLERLIIQNGNSGPGAGVYIGTGSQLTLNFSSVRNNESDNDGGGIAHYGNNLTLNNSSVISNIAVNGGGIMSFVDSVTVLNNSTVSGNSVRGSGGGIFSMGSLAVNSSTISGNTAQYDSGGVSVFAQGTHSLRNSIVFGNTAIRFSGECLGSFSSYGYNLVGYGPDCTFTPGVGDLINLDPLLGGLIGSPAYLPLSNASPAINAGDPAGCQGSTGLLVSDQRNAPRLGRCDIGAYEYTSPGPAASIMVMKGNLQSTPPGLVFRDPLIAVVLDSQGSPVSNIAVTFIAPYSGASGTFVDGNNHLTVTTDGSGMAIASAFLANNQFGSYTVTSAVSGLPVATFNLENKGWYVSSTGSNANSCDSPLVPCLTINTALSRATEKDTILVVSGIYKDSWSMSVANIYKSILLSGGWDNDFITQTGTSIIDGEGIHPGVYMLNASDVVIERFTIQNGYLQDGVREGGGGIASYGGKLTINNSTIINNKSDLAGGGIYVWGSMLNINNSTVTENKSQWGGGISLAYGGMLKMNNTTISNNTAGAGGGVFGYTEGVHFKNSIVAGNTATDEFGPEWSGPDFIGGYTSEGYNLIGVPATIGGANISGTGDLINVDPKLDELVGTPAYFPLLSESPAIDAGNPAIPGSSENTCTMWDERGAPRPIGARCDIGAYESGLQISGNTGIAGAILDFTDVVHKTAESDVFGNFKVYIPDGWTGSLTPVKAGFVFTPDHRGYINLQTDLLNQDFTAVPGFVISGNAGAVGVALNFIDGVPRSAISNQDGDYFLTVNPGWTGTVIPAKMGNYIFSPASRSYASQAADVMGENYTLAAYATFSDVPTNYWAWAWIESLFSNNVTSGCSAAPLRYCPDSTVTRAQMAVFLLRAKYGSTYVPPKASGLFADVSTDYWAADWIEQLAADGITSSCASNPRRYCPEMAVTRDQMAVFLLRAKYGQSYAPPVARGSFADVAKDYWAASWIEQLEKEGITSGCSSTPRNYCPGNAVLRDQMAIFLVRTFGLK